MQKLHNFSKIVKGEVTAEIALPLAKRGVDFQNSKRRSMILILKTQISRHDYILTNSLLIAGMFLLS